MKSEFRNAFIREINLLEGALLGLCPAAGVVEPDHEI